MTLMGVILANQRIVPVQRITEFKESLTILLISALFILLSARVRLEDLIALGWHGPAFALAMVFLVRPLAVWAATIGSQLTRAERLFLAWFAPADRGGGRGFGVRLAVGRVRRGAGAGDVPGHQCHGGGVRADRRTVRRRLGLTLGDPQGLPITSATDRARLGDRPAAGRISRRPGQYTLRVRAEVRSQGLTAFYADVLSEHVLNAVDFGELGRFLALTPNHDVNTLAAMRFREVFGREHVFQLPAAAGRPAREERALHHFVGRSLFGADCTYDQLDKALDRGATLKVTRLSSEFDYQAFQAHYGDRARLLAVIQGKRLSLATADAAPAPKPGQAVVCLIEPGGMGIRGLRPLRCGTRLNANPVRARPTGLSLEAAQPQACRRLEPLAWRPLAGR